MRQARGFLANVALAAGASLIATDFLELIVFDFNGDAANPGAEDAGRVVGSHSWLRQLDNDRCCNERYFMNLSVSSNFIASRERPVHEA